METSKNRYSHFFNQYVENYKKRYVDHDNLFIAPCGNKDMLIQTFLQSLKNNTEVSKEYINAVINKKVEVKYRFVYGCQYNFHCSVYYQQTVGSVDDCWYGTDTNFDRHNDKVIGTELFNSAPISGSNIMGGNSVSDDGYVITLDLDDCNYKFEAFLERERIRWRNANREDELIFRNEKITIIHAPILLYSVKYKGTWYTSTMSCVTGSGYTAGPFDNENLYHMYMQGYNDGEVTSKEVTNLAFTYLCKQDFEKTYKLLKLIDDDEYSNGKYHFIWAHLYYFGEYVNKDIDKANKHINKASEYGYDPNWCRYILCRTQLDKGLFTSAYENAIKITSDFQHYAYTQKLIKEKLEPNLDESYKQRQYERKIKEEVARLEKENEEKLKKYKEQYAVTHKKEYEELISRFENGYISMDESIFFKSVNDYKKDHPDIDIVPFVEHYEKLHKDNPYYEYRVRALKHQAGLGNYKSKYELFSYTSCLNFMDEYYYLLGKIQYEDKKDNYKAESKFIKQYINLHDYILAYRYRKDWCSEETLTSIDRIITNLYILINKYANNKNWLKHSKQARLVFRHYKKIQKQKRK